MLIIIMKECSMSSNLKTVTWSLNFVLREQFELWPKFTILWNLCETGFARMTEKPVNYFFFWQWTFTCDNCKSIICILLSPIFHYDFLSDCPSLMHGLAIRYLQHCKAMHVGACSMWARSLFLLFSISIICK